MTRHSAEREWAKYVRRNLVEPKYARCLIEWHEDKSMSAVTIALFPHSPKVSKYDDQFIFFYANGKDDFLRLFNETGEDFTIRVIYNFSNSID